MRFPIIVAVVSPLLFLFATAGAEAQASARKPAVYTYVAQWAVPRTQWADMTKMQQGNTALLDRLVSDGTLLAYGYDEATVHDSKGPTHSNWFQSSSMAGLYKTLDALQGSTASASALLGSGSHDDALLVSRDYDGHPGTYHNSVLRGISVVAKPGMENQFHEAFDRVLRPVLQRLTDEGAVHAWSYQNQWLVKDPGRVFIVTIFNGPEGLDRYTAAINQLFDSNPDAVAPLMAASEGSSRRDFLLRVISMRQK